VSGLRRSIIRHRKVWLIVAASVLGVFVPLPGYLFAAWFWPAGIHDIDSTREGVVFVVTVVGASVAIWAALANWLLPRNRETAGTNQE
jgi:hypothetical protein